MPKGKDGGKLYKAPKLKVGNRVEVKYRHSSLKVRQGKDGSPEVECPSCQEYMDIKYIWSHSCKNPIIGRLDGKPNE